VPLPKPNLDDRRFQEIVDQAKRLIPHYTPEWTDHNVSDPGVALIELFAWMTDMVLYRMNQVPDKMLAQFMELVGVRLQPPRAARAPVTFYLSAPQEQDLLIPEGTEVATVRTETSPAIVFTTEASLTIRPPRVLGALQFFAGSQRENPWVPQDLRRLELPGERLPLFSPEPQVGDAFYIALEHDHSGHVLALVLECEEAGGVGVDPRRPPIEWQVWQGPVSRWVPCEVEHDGTGGFNYSGEVILHLPPMQPGAFQGLSAYWLRVRLSEAQAGAGGYRVSPEIRGVRLESRGGTVGARHATTVVNEYLGQSEGTPGQSFKLRFAPILPRDPGRDTLIVEPPGGPPAVWQEVEDFADSGPEDRHYTLDPLEGTVTLGPALLQPDGSVYRFSQIPPKGSVLRFTRYQWGGGVGGNVPKGALSVLKSSVPYVARVTNRQEAAGGADAQSLEDARQRLPQVLRTRHRAVTADDYEHLATQVPGVARACCLAPGPQPAAPGEPRPGEVVLVVLPQIRRREGLLTPEDLMLSAELRSAVLGHLEDRRVLGSRLEVRAPQLVWVSVEARLRPAEPALAAEVQAWAEAELYRYLDPFTGGPRGEGWPFGRALHVSELYALLQRHPGVEFVEELQIALSEPGSSAPPQPAPHRLGLARGALICSSRHQVQVL
jgi:predicted phage baseplate assembly protein